jgi:hypothetical protein
LFTNTEKRRTPPLGGGGASIDVGQAYFTIIHTGYFGKSKQLVYFLFDTFSTLLWYFLFFFFLIAIPVFSHTAFYGTFRSAVFSIPISFAFSGDATGLRGTFPGHPRPFHLTFTDIHNNIYTPMGAFSRRDSNPC